MKIILIDDAGVKHEFNKFVDLHIYETYMQIDARNTIVGQLNDFSTSRIPFTDSRFCQDATLIYLADDEAVRIFVNRCKKEGCNHEGIKCPGVYRRDTRFDSWEDIDSVITYLKFKAKHLELAKETFLKS